MNSIPVKEVTNELLREFFVAYWANCGSQEEDFMVKDYAETALKSFRYGLEQKAHYVDGARWDIMTYELGCPTGVWPHVKVRYRIQDPMDGTPFEDQKFEFVVYGNSIAEKKMHSRVTKAVKALVEKLASTFPVVAEG